MDARSEDPLARDRLHFLIERAGSDRLVRHVERVQKELNVGFVDLGEEVLQSVLARAWQMLVEKEKSKAASCDVSRDKPFVKFVHLFQIGRCVTPHGIVDQIERSVRDELVQMAVVGRRRRHGRRLASCCAELDLVDDLIGVPDDDEVVVRRGHLHSIYRKNEEQDVLQRKGSDSNWIE